MKAFWINSTTQTITEVEYSGLADLQRMVGGYIEIVHSWDNGDVIFGDEEGLLKGLTTWFRLEGHDRPYSGNAVLVGAEDDDEGPTADPTITLEQLTELVTFINQEQALAWASGNASEPAVAIGMEGDTELQILATMGQLFGVSPGDKRK